MRVLALACLTATVLAMGPVTAAAADNESSRVWVVYKQGNKGAVHAALRSANATVHYQFDELNAFAVTLPARSLAGLARNPNIEYVEEDPRREPYAASIGETPPYGIGMVQATTMQSAGHVGQGVRVCIIDTGLKVHANVPAPGSSVTYVSGNLDPQQDGYGHGSHVAGTLAADNFDGNVGVAPGAALIIVRVFDDDGAWTYSSTLIDAASRCRDNNARIISMSLGGALKSRTEQRGFDTLYANGILSIAAAGNAGNGSTSYPAGYGSIVSVAAVDADMQHADFSQVNRDVELSAPGVAVWSTVPWVAEASVTAGGTTHAGNGLEGAALSNGTAGTLIEGGLCDAENVAYSGRVVHCLRGTISFADKVANAESSGAIAVVISNNVDGEFLGTLDPYVSAIPAVGVTQASGQALTGLAGSSATVVNVLDDTNTGYEAWNGTSMATPHVSGVAALLWAACSNATAVSVRNAMTATALDLGAAGRDRSFGYGLVQACSAANLLCGACSP